MQLRRLIGLLLLLTALSGVSLHAWAKPAVEDLRIGAHPDKTRFVLELSEEPAYRVFTLASPYRVVIDLAELDWTLPSEVTPKSGGVIAMLRHGLFAPGTTRVVLDAEQPVAVKAVFLLPPNGTNAYRLVVDLAKVSASEFAAAQQSFVSDKPLPKPEPITRPQVAAGDDRITVVIDPGHGGVDPGAIGRSGIYEKHIVLSFAKELARGLEKQGRYNVVMTREQDIFVKLGDRREIARKAGADLFISIHADSHGDAALSGTSVYTLSEKSSDSVAAQLAASENKADLIAGIELEEHPDEVSNILLDLTQRETMNLSARFAAMLVEDLKGRTELLRNTHRFAGFVVLKAHDVPSVLVELGFLSNPNDERKLKSEKERAQLVSGLVDAVDRYFAWQQSMR
ncbi:MAG: N-acetylmuramoyl-L-alanine amidase [Limibacillus sp.]